MAKRSSKPTDLNERAAAIVAQSTDPDDEGDDPYEGKNPYAVELGRLGGKKGGKARGGICQFLALALPDVFIADVAERPRAVLGVAFSDDVLEQIPVGLWGSEGLLSKRVPRTIGQLPNGV